MRKRLRTLRMLAFLVQRARVYDHDACIYHDEGRAYVLATYVLVLYIMIVDIIMMSFIIHHLS